MTIIVPANTLAAGGFDVDNSVRFNDGDSAYMHKTAAAGNRRTFTFSTWFKRGQLGTNQQLFNSYSAANAGGFAYMQLEAIESGVVGDRISLEVYGTILLKTTQVLRDPSSWYHLVIAVDTTSGTANNRCRMYLNGTEITDFVTRNNPDQNFDFAFNQNNIDMYLGSNNYGGNKGNYFDGYMAEVVWIDGTQYAATDFGEFDEDSNIWKPLESVSDLTFGTNGFYLDFKASGNLGNDANGGTDLTEVNLAAVDQTTDTCTNNFCTINPLVNGIQRNPTLSEGNTFLTNTSGAWKNCLSSFAASSGKWYFEIKPTLHGTSYVHAGIFPVDDWQNQVSGYPNFGGTANSWSYDSDGNIVNNDGNANTSPATYTTNNIIGIAVDLDNNKFYAYKNNALQVAGGTSINANIEYYFGGMGYNSNIAFNFGNPSYANSSSAADGNGYGAFEYAPPSGFFSINTKNLAEYG